MPRTRWILVSLGGLILLAALFLLTGGMYRTVNAGGGRVYVVNRFTGETRVVRGEVITRLKSEAQAKREEAKAKEEEEKQTALKRQEEVQDAAVAASAAFVGDRATKLYHAWYTPLDTSNGPGCLAQVSTPVYFDNALEATKADYWPCRKCLRPALGTVKATSASVRDWPRAEAPVLFSVKSSESVTLLGSHGDYYAMPTEVIATGKRGVGWIAQSAVEVSLTWPAMFQRDRWREDARTARQLRNQGQSASTIAKEKGWKEDYVARLLAGQEPDYERQSVP